MLHLLSDFILKNIFISNAGNHTTNEVIDFRPGGAFLVVKLRILKKLTLFDLESPIRLDRLFLYNLSFFEKT